MKEIAQLMGGEARVKIMRLFLFNPDTAFDAADIRKRCRVTAAQARKEINTLFQTYFVNEKSFTKETELPPLKSDKTKTPRIKKKKVHGWILNTDFPLLKPMRQLLVSSNLTDPTDLLERFKGMGPIKFFAVSGIFMDDDSRKLDLLIVGSKLNRKKIDRAIKIIESEIGRELRYAIFDNKEFKYRLDMYDKLIRDVFDYEHEILMNKLKGLTL